MCNSTVTKWFYDVPNPVGKVLLACLMSINIKRNPRQDITLGIPGVGTGVVAFLGSVFCKTHLPNQNLLQLFQLLPLGWITTKTGFNFKCNRNLGTLLYVLATVSAFPARTFMLWHLHTAVQLILTHSGWPICLLRFHNCCCCC